jgi:hypothetical protein
MFVGAAVVDDAVDSDAAATPEQLEVAVHAVLDLPVSAASVRTLQCAAIGLFSSPAGQASTNLARRLSAAGKDREPHRLQLRVPVAARDQLILRPSHRHRGISPRKDTEQRCKTYAIH